MVPKQKTVTFPFAVPLSVPGPFGKTPVLKLKLESNTKQLLLSLFVTLMVTSPVAPAPSVGTAGVTCPQGFGRYGASSG
jgi:hypothetical protein